MLPRCGVTGAAGAACCACAPGALGGAPKIIVEGGASGTVEATGEAWAGAAGGWPNTIVPLGGGSFAWVEAGAEGNMIVRPAASSAAAGGGGAEGKIIVRAAGSSAGNAEGVAAGFGLGAANAIVICPEPLCGSAADPEDACGAGRATRKVFWHFPQRIVSPCAPMRASSTR